MNDVQLLRYKDQEVRELRAEVARLRKRVGETGRHARRVEQAYKDAVLLASWRAVHIFPSRSYAAYHQISQRRWQNAIALLKLARVLDGRRWLLTDAATIEQCLDCARKRAIEQPESYKMRLNRHGRQ